MLLQRTASFPLKLLLVFFSNSQGAAPLISNKDMLGVAAGILAVEAYHGGAIRAKLLKANKQVKLLLCVCYLLP